MTDTGWVYWSDGEHGPFSDDNLAALVRQGKLDAHTDLRRANQTAWVPAAKLLPELFPTEAAGDAAAATSSWTDTKAHMWRRYAARITDSLIVGAILGMLMGIVFFSIAPTQAQAFFGVFKGTGGRLLDIIFTQALVIPVNALTIGLSGLSMGKWIFGVRVLKDGKPIGFLRALRRELGVFFVGLGAGIPLISLFTLIRSATDLNDRRSTPWDRAQKLTVVHRPESSGATIGMIVGVLGLIALRVLLQIQGMK